MTEREALKLALEALENLPALNWIPEKDMQVQDAITAIKEALAQPEQDYIAGVPPMLPQMRDGETIVVTEYAQPEQEEIERAMLEVWQDVGDPRFPHIAQPEQEPVAYWNFNNGFSHCMIDQLNEAAKKNPAPLYTTPPQPEPVIDKSAAVRIATALGWEPKRTWVGLTDEERQDIALEVPMDAVLITEAKLKEKNGL